MLYRVMILLAHTGTGVQGGLPLSTEMALGGFALGGVVLAVLFYDAYRQHREWW